MACGLKMSTTKSVVLLTAMESPSVLWHCLASQWDNLGVLQDVLPGLQRFGFLVLGIL